MSPAGGEDTRMSSLHALLAGALLVSTLGVAAPATDPPAVTSFVCFVGDVWTFQYTAKAAVGAGLNGSETWTQGACGDRYVLHPSGALIKADIVTDANGNLYSAFSPFTGTRETYNKPFPFGRLPLEPGATWDSAIDIDLGGGDGLTGNGHWKVIGWETVTVPAGTYVCLRKELALGFDFTPGGSAANGPISGDFRETSWYSPDVRTAVKTIASDSFGDHALIELSAVTLQH